MSDEREWKPIETAPYETTLWVRNPVMVRPIKATRGYAPDGIVNPDTSLFTSMFTNERYFPMPGGRLVCPTEWTECTPDELHTTCLACQVWDEPAADAE
jgi:hypothetical protein